MWNVLLLLQRVNNAFADCNSNSDTKWKREEYPDHKWDFIDVDDFVSTKFTSYLNYFWLYVSLLLFWVFNLLVPDHQIHPRIYG